MILHSIYFSAKGTTEKCADCIGREMNLEMKSYNWFKESSSDILEIPYNDVLLFSMPVYGGYIPQLCADMAKNLKGNRTPAIIAAVYGNRHYDDALLQMKDILMKQGFIVIAAGAFLAEHSVFPTVAAGRPDAEDENAMKQFAVKCCQILNSSDWKHCEEIVLPETPGYDGYSYEGLPFKPNGNDKCISCGECAEICPVKAIDKSAPKETNHELCIACGACIKACPAEARNYHCEAYEQVRIDFEKMCSVYRTPETFYIGE
ncbi:MAG: 4Fe-4S binding protein [Oscillospiraceae bacterium]|nr:4Fe-4S binding protein [Oscillospiraceae bacterium]